MEHPINLNPVAAMLFMTTSFITAAICWISLKTTLFGITPSLIKEVIGYVAAIVSISAGVMAVRYYYYATKKIRNK